MKIEKYFIKNVNTGQYLLSRDSTIHGRPGTSQTIYFWDNNLSDIFNSRLEAEKALDESNFGQEAEIISYWE